MGLLQQIRHDVKAGLARLRFGTVKAAHRALEETELLNLRLEARKLDRRINDLYRDIGERAVELHERGEPAGNILSDRDILSASRQVTVLKAQRGRIAADVEDVLRED